MRRIYLVIPIVFLLFLSSFAGLATLSAHAVDPEPGWDFEDHTYNHKDLTKLNSSEIAWEMQMSNKAFQVNGLPTPEHLAYPNGDFNQSVISAVSQNRKSGRTAGSGFSYFPETYPVQEWYSMSSACFSTAVNWTTIQGWIDLAITKKGLLNLFTHDVSETPKAYGTTPEMLAQLLDYLVAKQNAGLLWVMTIWQAYNSYDGRKAVVVISFDDGYATTYTSAWPMFKARSLKGTSYINAYSPNTGDPAFMSWAMIREMAQPLPPNEWSISITSSSSERGSSDPNGLKNVTSGTFKVTAYPKSGYSFHYWIFDGYNLTDNPVTLPCQPNGTSHSLSAFFLENQSAKVENAPLYSSLAVVFVLFTATILILAQLRARHRHKQRRSSETSQEYVKTLSRFIEDKTVFSKSFFCHFFWVFKPFFTY